ncbi:MAG: DUF2236 domain-containing protein [Gammaproteobacteria bacterium]|nr:DUF2236 domain-containing protein [Gammaproteobacteria bacterium]MYF37499.1 DUF2236 domain-containing protein [Gammaproteobacteria bacterium]
MTSSEEMRQGLLEADTSKNLELDIPKAYHPRLEGARDYDRARTDNYLKHTRIGDPALDRVLEELADMQPADLHKFLKAGIELEDDVIKDAPQVFREFFDDHVGEPDWLDFEAHRPAIRAFHLNTTNILVAFVTGVLIEGFATLISKSFATTGRVLNANTAKRRLMQNNRHLLETYMPGGLRRYGDGWKLSMRLRFIHARVRFLFRKQGDVWDEDFYGTPISAAHLGFAATVFSMRLLEHAKKVGAVFTRDEEKSLMELWRYASYVMGIPETILFHDQQDARALWSTVLRCEPWPDEDAVRMSNALIHAIPLTAGIEDSKEIEKTLNLGYTLSRALIGKELSSQLGFPKKNTVGALPLWRFKVRLQRMFRSDSATRQINFGQMLEVAAYDSPKTAYLMPNHYLSTKSQPW